MIAVAAFLAVAIAALWLGPRLLTAGAWQVRFPRAALAGWHAAVAVGVLAAVASIVAAVTATIAARETPDASAGIVQTIAGWGALGALGAALVVIAAGSEATVVAGRRSFGDVLALPHTRERLDRRTVLLTCRDDEPFACAIAGRESAVVVSTGLRALLTPAQLEAVVAHERTHLRGRHYVALRLAELNRACLPSLRAGTQLLRATTLLVELIADDAAARRAGAVHLANALVQVARSTHDPAMELRAERLAGRAWTPACRLAEARRLARP